MPLPRPLTPDDAEGYLALRREMLLDSPWAFLSAPGDDVASDAAAVAEQLRKPENVIVGVFDSSGSPVSVAGVYRSLRLKTRHRAHVWGVYTTPRFRGQGFGHAVVQAAIGVAWSWPGVESVSLSCSARATAALAMYRDLGFVVWGTEPDAMRVDGQGADEVHMALLRGER